MRSQAEGSPRAGERVWVHLILLWLAGNSLRLTVLAVPPLLPAIHRDLRLSEAAIGVLVGLPVLLLSIGAVFGSLLVARLGARRALIAGLWALPSGRSLCWSRLFSCSSSRSTRRRLRMRRRSAGGRIGAIH